MSRLNLFSGHEHDLKDYIESVLFGGWPKITLHLLEALVKLQRGLEWTQEACMKVGKLVEWVQGSDAARRVATPTATISAIDYLGKAVDMFPQATKLNANLLMDM